MIRVLVTGGNGQLASSIKSIQINHPNLTFTFTDNDDLDITNIQQVEAIFNTTHFDFCVNCAAYTAVDKAESETQQAEEINAKAVLNLANVCKTQGTILIHISTDFVFDGLQTVAYKETDATHPLSVYGATKLKGEVFIKTTLESYFIIRTSWLYSEFGTNFMKTMLRLAKEKTALHIVSDQIGTPTYATDLAQVICKIIESNSKSYGVYHYSNAGVASWYDFAKAILELSKHPIITHPILSKDYPTSAKRPAYSVLDTSKIKHTFQLDIPHWKVSLKHALLKLHP